MKFGRPFSSTRWSTMAGILSREQRRVLGRCGCGGGWSRLAGSWEWGGGGGLGRGGMGVVAGVLGVFIPGNGYPA